MMNRVPLLQFGSTGFKIFLLVFFGQTNKHVCTHIHIWLHGGWGRKGGGGRALLGKFRFPKEKKAPLPLSS